jgi:hypothetical protein
MDKSSFMIPIMPEEEFQKLSEEEQNAQWDREMDSMTPEDVDRFYFNCVLSHAQATSLAASGALAVARVIQFQRASWWMRTLFSKIRTLIRKSKIPATGQLVHPDTQMTGNGAKLCRTGHPKPGSHLDLGVDVIVPQDVSRKSRRRRK